MKTKSEIERCSECNAKLEPIFKATRFRRDWLFKQCDTCLDLVCDDCSETDDNGVVTCSSCMQMEALRNSGIIKPQGREE